MTSRHCADAADGVDIQRFITVPGVRSTLMIDGIDVKGNFSDTAPIAIGHHSMLGSNCNLVTGSRVPPYSVVAMGSVVVPGLDQDGSLFAGVPAKLKKKIDRSDYVLRTVGAVAPRPRS
jgi:acetyltransferase-like isoleucine patch superfamily enzyme